MAPMERRHRISRTELARRQRKAAAMKKAAQLKEDWAVLIRLHGEKERSRAVHGTVPSTSTQKSLNPPSFAPPIPELPSVYTSIDGFPNEGITNSSFGDELIQLGVPIDPMFASMPVNIEVEQQIDDVVDTAQEFEARNAQEHVTNEYNDEVESEVDPDFCVPVIPVDDHYPSGSDVGEATDNESGVNKSAGHADMGEMPVHESWLVQEEATSSRSPRLHTQKDGDIEVILSQKGALPSGLINVSCENVDNPFKSNSSPFSLNPQIDTTAQMACFLIITLHCLAGLATSWCEFLLKFFIFLFESLGQDDIAAQIPYRLHTAQSYAGLPTYNHLLLPVCPGCGDVFPTRISDPTECPRCSVPLYKGILHPTSSNSMPQATRKVRTPRIRLPFLSISAQLEGILSSPGIERAVDWWRALPREEGSYRNISDGKLWNEILDADGGKFFRSVPGKECAPDGELRIGVALAMDWFNVTRSSLPSSYSAAPLSFSIVSLPPHLRFRVSNLILTSIFPGPKEQSGDQVQRCLRPIVNDLYDLWKHGARIKTPSCQTGQTRLVRVVLVAVICDRPAASKVGGFASHSHRIFCPRDMVEKKHLQTSKCFAKDAFVKRTNESHRYLGAKYAKITSKTARDDFVKKEGTRFTQLSRLPYFDIVRCIVIDPMHNLILGLVKSHFYDIWIQSKILRPNHELKILHQILDQFELPGHIGRLPKFIGEPSGGALSADQWLTLALAVGPIAIPHLWDRCSELAGPNIKSRPEQVTAQIRTNVQKRRSAKGKGKGKTNLSMEAPTWEATKPDANMSDPVGWMHPDESSRLRRSRRSRVPLRQDSPKPDHNMEIDSDSENDDDGTFASTEPPRKRKGRVLGSDYSLNPRDPANFLKLASALNIFLAGTLTDDEIDQADELIREYNVELIDLYGPRVIKPNHHYSTHIAENIRDFGPAAGFWTYIFERLNKTLKNQKHNNHHGGVIETTWFTTFLLAQRIARMATTYQLSGDDFTSRVASSILETTMDSRGTLNNEIAEVINDSNNAAENCSGALVFSRRWITNECEPALYNALVQYLRDLGGEVRSMSEPDDNQGYPVLPTHTKFYSFVVHRRGKYSAARLSKAQSLSASLVRVRIPNIDGEDGRWVWCGVIKDLVELVYGAQTIVMVHMQWLVPWKGEYLNEWKNYRDKLGVQLWEYERYTGVELGMPPLVGIQSIECHVGRKAITIGGSTVWATVPLHRRGSYS